MAFFECNLPHKNEVPKIYQPDLMKKLMQTVELVHARTEKLNKALLIAKFKPESFQRVAKQVFDISNDRFDAMPPEELGSLCKALWDGVEDQDRIEWPNATVLYDTWFVTTADWESLRHFGLGGSESSVHQGCNHYTTPQALWFDKLGYPNKMIDHSKQAIFDRGHFLEDRVIDTFCRITGSVRIRETRMFASKDFPHMTANIDAIIRLASGELAIFEAKSAVVGKKGDWFGNKIPPNYITQMRQYAGVLNDDRIKNVFIGMIPCADITIDGTFVGSAYNDDYFHHCLPRDKDEEQRILREGEEFWQKYVAANVEPPKSLDPELDAATTLSYKPNPITDPAETPVEGKYDDHKEFFDALTAAEREYSENKTLLEILEQKRDMLRNEAKELLGASTSGSFVDQDGHTVLTIKNAPQKRTSIDAKKLKQFFPDAYEECAKTSVFTKFSLREY